MYRKRAALPTSLFLVAPLLSALVLARCADAPLTTGPADPLLSNHGKGATTTFVEFEFLFGGSPTGIGIVAPCLGGTFFISGMVPGWARITETPNGQVHVTEHWDFTQLSGRLGDETWSAAPGSGEMFSFNNHPAVGGSGAPVVGVVHQGTSKFLADGDMPDVFFIHRFRILRLPSGELKHSRMETETAEIKCIGPDKKPGRRDRAG